MKVPVKAKRVIDCAEKFNDVVLQAAIFVPVADLFEATSGLERVL